MKCIRFDQENLPTKIITEETIRLLDMVKQHPPNEPEHCWEFRQCLNETKNQCIVYQLGIAKECWVTNRMKPGRPGVMNNSCMYCNWFKKFNPPPADA